MFPNPNFNISGIPPWAYNNMQGNLPMNERNSTLRESVIPPPFLPQDMEPGFLRPPMPARADYRNLLAGSTTQADGDQASNAYQASAVQEIPLEISQASQGSQTQPNENSDGVNQQGRNTGGDGERANVGESGGAHNENTPVQTDPAVLQSIQQLATAVQSLGRRLSDIQNVQLSGFLAGGLPATMAPGMMAGNLGPARMPMGCNTSAWPGNTGIPTGSGLPGWNSVG